MALVKDVEGLVSLESDVLSVLFQKGVHLGIMDESIQKSMAIAMHGYSLEQISYYFDRLGRKSKVSTFIDVANDLALKRLGLGKKPFTVPFLVTILNKFDVKAVLGRDDFFIKEPPSVHILPLYRELARRDLVKPLIREWITTLVTSTNPLVCGVYRKTLNTLLYYLVSLDAELGNKWVTDTKEVLASLEESLAKLYMLSSRSTILPFILYDVLKDLVKKNRIQGNLKTIIERKIRVERKLQRIYRKKIGEIKEKLDIINADPRQELTFFLKNYKVLGRLYLNGIFGLTPFPHLSIEKGYSYFLDKKFSEILGYFRIDKDELKHTEYFSYLIPPEFYAKVDVVLNHKDTEKTINYAFFKKKVKINTRVILEDRQMNTATPILTTHVELTFKYNGLVPWNFSVKTNILSSVYRLDHKEVEKFLSDFSDPEIFVKSLLKALDDWFNKLVRLVEDVWEFKWGKYRRFRFEPYKADVKLDSSSSLVLWYRLIGKKGMIPLEISIRPFTIDANKILKEMDPLHYIVEIEDLDDFIHELDNLSFYDVRKKNNLYGIEIRLDENNGAFFKLLDGIRKFNFKFEIEDTVYSTNMVLYFPREHFIEIIKRSPNTGFRIVSEMEDFDKDLYEELLKTESRKLAIYYAFAKMENMEEVAKIVSNYIDDFLEVIKEIMLSVQDFHRLKALLNHLPQPAKNKVLDFLKERGYTVP